MSQDLSPGFANPVADAQNCFRAVLDAMAHPGQSYSIGSISAPPPLCESASALLLTLVDHETPLWLDPAASETRDWISFHTGAPAAATLGQSLFALALSLPDLATLPTGTSDVPETSATVILQVSSLQAGQRFWLEGPGLRQPSVLLVDGLPADFAAAWQRNHAGFPCGIDLILCAGNRLAALPRSVTVREA